MTDLLSVKPRSPSAAGSSRQLAVTDARVRRARSGGCRLALLYGRRRSAMWRKHFLPRSGWFEAADSIANSLVWVREGVEGGLGDVL